MVVVMVDRPAAVRPDAPSLLPKGWSSHWPNAGPKCPRRYTYKCFCRYNRPARIHSRVLNVASGKQKTTIRDRLQGARVHVSGAGKGSICARYQPCSVLFLQQHRRGAQPGPNAMQRPIYATIAGVGLDTQGGPPTRGRGQRTITQHGHNGGIAEL